MVLRPDEKAAIAEVELDKRFRDKASSLGKAGVAAASASIAPKILPFLSEFLPVDLAIKGISKISPQLGDFFKRGQKAGLDLKEGLDYVRKDYETHTKQGKDGRNLIEQYSPELHQFIDQQIRQGKKPLEAGALALLDAKGQKDFKKVIQKITKDHNANWSNILEMVYGEGDKGLDEGEAKRREGLNKFNQKKKGGIVEQEQDRFNQAYGQQAQQGQQSSGPGQQALMAILDKINQKLGQ